MVPSRTRPAKRNGGRCGRREPSMTGPRPQPPSRSAPTPDLFDADDRLQVGWVMLRTRAQGEMTVSAAGRSFGVSRQTFSRPRLAFQARDVSRLTQGDRGRKGPLKASVEVVEVVPGARAEDASGSSAEPARQVKQRFGISSMSYRPTLAGIQNWRATEDGGRCLKTCGGATSSCAPSCSPPRAARRRQYPSACPLRRQPL